MHPAATLTLFALALASPVQPGQQPPPAATSAAVAEPLTAAAGTDTPGHTVSPPKIIYSVEPTFTDQARKKKISSMCLVAVIVNADGSVTGVHLIRSAAEGQSKKKRAAAETLDEKAVAAVKQYRFAPAMLGGKPVAVTLTVEVNFQNY